MPIKKYKPYTPSRRGMSSADYSDLWTADAGLGSVEMGIKTVQDTLNVVDKPVVFCSSISTLIQLSPASRPR